MAKDASTATLIHLAIKPDGKVAQCISVPKFGDPELAKDVCRILSRKRFHSPTLRDGRKVHAFVDTMIRLFLPDTKEGRTIEGLRDPPDAELTVVALPHGNLADVSVNLAYDSAGKITDCAPAGGKEVALSKVACDQSALFDNTPQNDMKGQPVAYVTQKRFRFTVAPQPK
jgi:hypothetical protein